MAVITFRAGQQPVRTGPRKARAKKDEKEAAQKIEAVTGDIHTAAGDAAEQDRTEEGKKKGRNIRVAVNPAYRTSGAGRTVRASGTAAAAAPAGMSAPASAGKGTKAEEGTGRGKPAKAGRGTVQETQAGPPEKARKAPASVDMKGMPPAGKGQETAAKPHKWREKREPSGIVLRDAPEGAGEWWPFDGPPAWWDPESAQERVDRAKMEKAKARRGEPADPEGADAPGTEEDAEGNGNRPEDTGKDAAEDACGTGNAGNAAHPDTGSACPTAISSPGRGIPDEDAADTEKAPTEGAGMPSEGEPWEPGWEEDVPAGDTPCTGAPENAKAPGGEMKEIQENEGKDMGKASKAAHSAARRGDIFYIESAYNAVGHEQRGRRPAVIVSNDTGNRFSPVVEAVYLTSSDKAVLPTHAPILSAPKPSVALCEQVVTVDKRRLAKKIGELTEEETKGLDAALLVSLGLAGAAKA